MHSSNPIKDFKDYVGVKADLHEALDRNGKMVPPIKHCKNDYLQGVLDNVYWAPLYHDIKIRSCYRKPPKKEIFEELSRHLKNQGKDLGISDHKNIDP
jgi:hypothetical protein